MKLFVWDLHGTLEHGNHRAVVDISNEVLAQRGYTQRFTYGDGSDLYGLKWFEYFTWLLGDKAYDQAMELQDACFELSESNPEMQYRWVEPTPHASEVLAEIAEKHDQILISNTRPATLDVFLKTLDLESFFPAEKAFAVDQHTRDARRTKADILAEYLDHHPPYDEVVVIGDSPSDVRLREVGGGRAYLFTHADFQFRACDPDHRIRDLRGVLAAV